jgi:ATP-binding cassette subfamily F protein 3
MITFRNLTLRRGTKDLLQNINWTIYQQQRIGIIGANGSGKSSLFALLLQDIQPELGDLDIPKNLKLAHVAQETTASQQSAVDYVLDGDKELYALQKELTKAEEAHDGIKLGELHEKLSIIDGYTAPSRAAQLLTGLGFNHSEQQKTVSEFSGGWRVRLNLARALMARSDVLLLDEPTNHLDLDAVLWLEQWLARYTGTLLLISHDRDFLDKTVNHIAHLSHQQLKLYTGDYSTFETLRANALVLQQTAYDKQQKQISHMRKFINTFGAKASKAKQAQSRVKAIERLELVCAVQAESEFQFGFKKPDSCPNPLVTIHEGRVAYGERTILNNISLSITPKDRITMLGPNGAGKSSLIKLLAGELAPAGGTRETASGLKIGYFAQHQVDHLHLSDTPLLHLQRIAGNKQDLELRKFLGSFGFSGDRVLQPVQHFSGGEKSRLALALIVWQKPNLLLLDEPTNHLDLEMRQALSIALQEYEGAMLLVTHDRFLVRTTTDKLMLVAEGKLQDFDGDLDDYQKWLLDFRRQQVNSGISADKSGLSRKEQRQQNAKQRKEREPLMKKIQQLEASMAKHQQAAMVLETLLADTSLYEEQNKDKLQENLQKQTALIKEINQLEKEWLAACEERDNLL